MLTFVPLIAAVCTLHLAVTGTHHAYRLHKDAEMITLMAGSVPPENQTHAYTHGARAHAAASETFIRAVNAWAATVALLTLYALVAR